MRYFLLSLIAAVGICFFVGCPSGRPAEVKPGPDSDGLFLPDMDDSGHLVIPGRKDDDPEPGSLQMENELLQAQNQKLQLRERDLSRQLREALFERRLMEKQLDAMITLKRERDQALKRVKELETLLSGKTP